MSDELELRLRDHYRAADPGAASPMLAARIEVALEKRAAHPSSRWPAFRIAGTAGLAAIVAAAVLIGRPWEQAGPAPSLSPIATGPLVPRIIATVVLTPISGTMSWSPDGSRLAIATGGIELYDRRGQPVGQVWASDGVWVAPDALLARDADRTAGWRSTVALRGLDGSVRQTLPGTFGTLLLPSGHGAVALLPAPETATDTPSTTMVWNAEGLAGPVDGVARAWSGDGQRLAVFHETEPGSGVGGQPTGWLEILAHPGLSQVAAFPDVRVSAVGGVAFDPTGARLAICAWSRAGPPCVITVLDVATGRTTPVGPGAGEGFAWTVDGTLLYPEDDFTGILAWDGANPPRDAGLGAGMVVRVGALATAVGSWDDPASRSLAVASGGQVDRLALPGRFVAGPEWSADGQLLAVVVDANGTQKLVLAQLTSQ